MLVVDVVFVLILYFVSFIHAISGSVYGVVSVFGSSLQSFSTCDHVCTYYANYVNISIL